MSSIRYHRIVNAPIERTFEAFSDFENAAGNIRGIQSLELLGDGSIGVGTRFRETRVVFKKEATEEMEITAFERPTRITIGGESCGSLFQTDFRLSPEGSGTRVDIEFTATPVSLFAKLMSPLSSLMLKTCMKSFEGDLDDMTAVAEGRGVGAPAGVPAGS